MDDWKREEGDKNVRKEKRKEGGKGKERNTNIWESSHIIFAFFNEINVLEFNERNTNWSEGSAKLQISVVKPQEIVVSEKVLWHKVKRS